jgi:S-adenosylmethionine synthetase
MPMPILLAHKLTTRLEKMRQSKKLPWLRPDGKSQVTVEYENNKPKRIHTDLVSTQHAPDIKHRDLRNQVIEHIILPVMPAKLIDRSTKFHVNPTGRFVLGGPKADCGLTGRKIIVDTYGGRGRHGGGPFKRQGSLQGGCNLLNMARYSPRTLWPPVWPTPARFTLLAIGWPSRSPCWSTPGHRQNQREQITELSATCSP